MNYLLIKNMKDEEKPRERLMKYGKENLSNEELISIILRCGTKNISVKEISYKVINEYKDLRRLNINNLMNVKGIGRVKAITLLAALELGKRVYYESENKPIKIKNTEDVFNLLKYILNYEKQENFYVILLDSKNNIIAYKSLFKGTVNNTTVHPREVFKYAIENLAVFIIVAHNHPSGDPTPSEQDKEITNKLIEAGNLVGIKLIDHIVVAKENFFSFYEEIKNKKQ